VRGRRPSATVGAVAASCALVAALGAALSGAATNKDGDLIVAFQGRQAPNTLPRSKPAPVTVRMVGEVRSATGRSEQLPQLRTISVAINRQGKLFDRGLPVCEVRANEPATEAEARRICGESLVGSGRVAVQVRIPTQPFFLVHARLLVFKGPVRDGHKLILAQAYTEDPPGAFILTFRVARQAKGAFGTVLSTSLPRSAWQWAYLTRFEMSLHRTYVHRGVRRSYVSAACNVPAALDSAFFPFARATFGFADGRRLAATISGRCRVRN